MNQEELNKDLHKLNQLLQHISKESGMTISLIYTSDKFQTQLYNMYNEVGETSTNQLYNHFLYLDCIVNNLKKGLYPNLTKQIKQFFSQVKFHRPEGEEEKQ
jgi:hypothetical protein